MLLAEIFFSLSDLGTLQVANFGRDLIERRSDHGERREIVRMAVALNDLRRHSCSFQSQAGAHFLLEFRRKVGKGADGA